MLEITSADGYLSTLLEQYESALQQMTEYIHQAESQLAEAKSKREEVTAHITQLKGFLGLSEEDSTEEE